MPACGRAGAADVGPMRRPLLVLVLLATIALGWAQAAFAAVRLPSVGSQRGRAPRLQKLARSSWDQLRVGRPVRFARLRPGDLLFTEGGGHVQLVVSKRAVISAPQTGERVRYVPLAQLRPEFAGARRVLR